MLPVVSYSLIGKVLPSSFSMDNGREPGASMREVPGLGLGSSLSAVIPDKIKE